MKQLLQFPSWDVLSILYGAALLFLFYYVTIPRYRIDTNDTKSQQGEMFQWYVIRYEWKFTLLVTYGCVCMKKIYALYICNGIN